MLKQFVYRPVSTLTQSENLTVYHVQAESRLAKQKPKHMVSFKKIFVPVSSANYIFKMADT